MYNIRKVCIPMDKELCQDALDDFDHLPKLFKKLQESIKDNEEFFRNSKGGNGLRFKGAFSRISGSMKSLKHVVIRIANICHLFDYSRSIKGNGYRSLIKVTESCLDKILELSVYCEQNRSSFLFRSHHYSSEVEAYCSTLAGLTQLLHYTEKIYESSEGENLFPPEKNYDAKLLMEVESMEKECFYGRTLGFQYSPSMKSFLGVVSVAMASFADGYHRHETSFGRAASSLLHSGKYLVNPEFKAQRIVSVIQKTSMEFCKTFWSLTENYGLQHVPLLVCPAMKVNQIIQIPAEPFQLETTTTGETVTITPPLTWMGPVPVQARLLSFEWREGQTLSPGSDQVKKPIDKSDGLLFHIHGGGFVAQSSKSHEMYLRSWARELNVPILSVDYSLAPEAPFPRALEECFCAYAWALKNAHLLGTTAKTICLAGDSAGGNLCISVALRAAVFGIRLPDSILAAYTPLNVQYTASPSRILAFMDPLLPQGILAGCLAAYAGLEKSPFDECTKESINHVYGKKSKKKPIPVKSRSDDTLTTRKSVSAEATRNNKSAPVSPKDERYTENLSNSSLDMSSFHSARDMFSPRPMIIEADAPIMNILFQGQVYSHDLSPEDEEDRQRTSYLPAEKTSQDVRSKSSNSQGEICRSNEDLNGIASVSISERPSHLDVQSIGSVDEVINPSSDILETKKRTGQKQDVCITFSKEEESCHIIESSCLAPNGSLSDNNFLTPFEHDALRTSSPLEQGTANDQEEEEEEESWEDARSRACSMSQVDLPIARNPFMSPLLADDEMLRSLPPIDLVACSLDPILDDSIEFAKRLRNLENDVELYVLDELPHGFLSFNLVSQESREACDLCVKCLQRTFMGKRKHMEHMQPAPVY